MKQTNFFGRWKSDFKKIISMMRFGGILIEFLWDFAEKNYHKSNLPTFFQRVLLTHFDMKWVFWKAWTNHLKAMKYRKVLAIFLLISKLTWNWLELSYTDSRQYFAITQHITAEKRTIQCFIISYLITSVVN